MDYFDVDEDGNILGGPMQISEQFTLAEMGRLFLVNRALEARVAELQTVLKSQGSDNEND